MADKKTGLSGTALSLAGATVGVFVVLVAFGADVLSFISSLGPFGVSALVLVSIGVGLILQAFGGSGGRPTLTGLKKLEVWPRVRVGVGCLLALAGVVSVISVVVARSTVPGPEDPSEIPTLVVTGDRRTVDPCGLIDLPGLREFGAISVSPGIYLNGCTAHLGDFDAATASAFVQFGDPSEAPSAAVESPRGPVLDLGGAQLQKYSYYGGGEYEAGCVAKLTLADQTPIWVRARVVQGQPVDVCRLADVTVAGVTRKLAQNGIRYDPNRVDRIKLARFDACFGDLESQTFSTHVPGIRADLRAPAVEASKCTIGDYANGEPSVVISFQIWSTTSTAGSLRTLNFGDRSASLYSSIGEGGCVSYILAVPRSPLGPSVSEYLAVEVHGLTTTQEACDAVVELSTAVNERLPASL